MARFVREFGQTSMKLRVGLIGLGSEWEARYRPALKALSDRFEVRAVCCEVAMKAEHVARDFQADTVDGFRAMIAREDVDVVLSLAPDWVGALPILAACEQGKAVYSSGALDIDPGQVHDVKQRVEASGVAFMAEFPRRHSPATLRLKELIATSLGPPRLLFCHERLTCEQRTEPSRRVSDCPVTMRDSMELIDWCRYVVGADPLAVSSVRQQNLIGGMVSDYEVMSLAFPSPSRGDETGSQASRESDNGQSQSDPSRGPEQVAGQAKEGSEQRAGQGSGPVALDAAAQLECGQHLPDLGRHDSVVAQISIGHYVPARWADALAYRRPASLKVVCENGIAFIDLPSTLLWFDDAGQHMESLEAERPVGEQLLTHFHRAVTSLIRKTSSLEDAYRALTVVLTAEQSRREGRRIPLSF